MTDAASEDSSVTDPILSPFVDNLEKRFEVTVVYSHEVGSTKWPDHSLSFYCTA
jgi:hypothetical protein